MSVLLGNGDGTFQSQVTYAVGSAPYAIVAGDFNGDGHARPGRRNIGYDTRVGAAGQRRRHLPAPGRRTPVGTLAGRHRGGGLHRRRPARPRRRQVDRTRPAPVPCRCCWATATGRSRPSGSPTRSGAIQTPSWRATSTATAGSTWPSPTGPNACRCCWATATARSSPRSPTRWGRNQTRSWRVTSTATAGSTWPSRTASDGTVSVLLGNGDGTFQPAGHLRSRVRPDRHRGGRLHRRRPCSTWPSPNCGDGTVSVLLGNGDGTFQPQVTYAVGSEPARHRGGRLQRRRPARPGRRQRTRGDGLGPAGQRRRHVPAPGHLRGRVEPRRDRGGRLQWRRPSRPGRANGLGTTVGPAGQRRRDVPARRSTYRRGAGPRLPSWPATSTATAMLDLAVANASTRLTGDVSVLLGNGDGTFQPQVTYAVGCGPDAIVAGDFTGDGRLDLAIANADASTVSVLLGNGDGTFSHSGQSDITPMANAPGRRRQRRRHRRCAGRRWGRRHPLPPGHPRAARHLRAARHGQPRRFPRAISPGSRTPIDGPLLASVDAQDDAVSLYAYRDGASSGSARWRPARSRRRSSRPTSTATAGTTWSSAMPATARSRCSSATTGVGRLLDRTSTSLLPPLTLAVGLGVSDVEAVDTTGDGASISWSPTS